MRTDWKSRLILWLVPPVASLLLRAVGWTLRIQFDVPAEIDPRTKSRRGMIYVAWHSRLLLGMFIYRRRNIHVLVSQSRDGELLTRSLARFGFAVVRGSSSRGAAGSLKRLAEILEEGHDVMVAPDGPRGPSEQAKMGAIQVAALSGAPIVPWTWAGARMIRLRSWDRLRIPVPFSRCLVVSGNPLQVPRDCSRDDLERKRQDLEAELQRLTGLERSAFPGLNT